MANVYIDISQIKNKKVYSEGYDNTQDEFTEADLLVKYQFYLDAADNWFKQVFQRLKIAEADVKTFASGDMTENVKEMIVSYSYYRYFDDNCDYTNEEDPMLLERNKYLKRYKDLLSMIDVSDIINVIPSGEDDNYPYWMDRE